MSITCAHPTCAKEEPEERLGLLAAKAFLGDDGFKRVCQNERVGSVVDYRSPSTAVEVKALKQADLEQLHNAYDRKTEAKQVIKFPGLQKTWFVMLDASAAAGERSEYRGAPSIRRLEQQLGPLLLQLEAQGISDSFGAEWPLRSHIASILHGGNCSVIDSPSFGPGIFLAGVQSGHGRPYSLDRAVRDRIQDWIDSDSSKMAASFVGESGLRCGVLVVPLKGIGFSMWRSLSEDFPNLTSVPTEPLTLPEGIDTLIIVTGGGQAIRFAPPDKWTRIELPR
ncbi:hypothetical protein [Nocardia testacea]|uniref:hypothetical protein n=1 Tax=Nocardia testacea TaxID=248551 RepID=UPI003A856B79